MIKDPDHYLKKANYFYTMSRLNDDDYDDSEYELVMDKVDDINDIELVKVKIDSNKNQLLPQTQTQTQTQCIKPKLKPGYTRYYDPITKHYYKMENMFDVEVPEKKITKTDIWFPENKLSFKTMRDPKTGNYYKVTKIYGKDGNYDYKYEKLNYRPIKKSGNTFYQPSYH